MSRAVAWPRLLAALLLAGLAGCAAKVPPATVEVNLAAINDLHGYLQANPFRYPDPSAPTGVRALNAGGIATLGGMLDSLRAEDPQLLLVGAGDLIGASPALSALWADEPTLEALGLMGLKLSALGNHELDQGKQELLRQIQGGCESPRPEQACKFRNGHAGTRFPYLAVNLIDSESGKPLLPGYRIEQVHGVKIAFIGALLRGAAATLRPSSLAGLRVEDEVEAINRLVPQLEAQGVNAIVVTLHQGGGTPDPFDQQDCRQLSGPIVEVAQRLDPAVDVLISGHSHQGYLCRVDQRLVTQAGSYGHLLTHLTLSVTPGEHRVTQVRARNLLADPARYPPNPQLAALQHEAEERGQAILQRPIARIATTQVSRRADAAGESALGDLIADAQLAATQGLGAQIALTNSHGIRGDLSLEAGQEQLNYAQLASVQPFNNRLHLLTLSGAQLVQLLNQQWQAEGFLALQVSGDFSYRWDARRPTHSRVLADSLRLQGQPVLPDAQYRVALNAFLAEGGGGFSMLRLARERRDTGITDLDALLGYLEARERAGQPAGAAASAGRIVRVDGGLSHKE